MASLGKQEKEKNCLACIKNEDNQYFIAILYEPSLNFQSKNYNL